MITKIGIQFYQLTPLDGFALRVTGNGVQYHVVASLDTTVLPLQDGVPFLIPPNAMNGAGSLHLANIHCFFNPGSAPDANYIVEVLDPAGGVVDVLGAQIPGQPPTQAFFQLIFVIVV